MPRFSSKAKKVIDLIMYKTDIESAIALVKDLTTPFDLCFAKILIAYYCVVFFQRDLALKNLKEAEEIIKQNPDNFLLYYIKCTYLFYFLGVNSPLVSTTKANEYFHESEALYQQIEPYDDYERFFCKGFYYYNQGFYSWLIENNLSKGIDCLKKALDFFSEVPLDGDYFSKAICYNNLGACQRFAGYFDESEQNLLISLEVTKKYDNLWQRFPLTNLIMIYFQKGELSRAIEMDELFLSVSQKFNDLVGIYTSLEMQGDILYAQGNYPKALEAYQESLNYRKKHTDGLELFKGYGNIFEFYYRSYKISKDREMLQKADQILTECTKLHERYPDDETIKNFSNFYQACIYKYGNLKKRVKAGDIFEELIKIYPNTVSISQYFQWHFVSEYLEILFEDYLVSEDEETITKIDSLITKIYEIPLTFTSIDSFVHQQLILSKYQFYIKGKINEAIELVTKAKEKIAPFKLGNLNSKLDSNLESFKQDRTKWDQIDISIKERIKQSEFDKYIQEAQSIKLL